MDAATLVLKEGLTKSFILGTNYFLSHPLVLHSSV